MNSIKKFARRFTFALLPVSFLVLALLTVNGSAQERESNEGRVYFMTNDAAANLVVVLKRSGEGQLSLLQEVGTGGLGSGPAPLPPPFPPTAPGPDGLSSQDSLVMTDDGRFLIAVNAGSNDVSVLKVADDGLELVDKVPSGGNFPVSVALHHNLVYVLNSAAKPARVVVGGIPTIRGFRLDHRGKLHEIPNSTIVTGPETSGPSDAVFSPDGDVLIVTERFSNMVDVFRVNEDGLLRDRTSVPSNTPSPFAVTFDRKDIFAVTEVNGLPVGVINGATASSYRLTEEDTIEPISRAVPSGQTAACWLRFTPNHRYGYTANPGSGSLTSFRVSRLGELSLLASIAADTGGPFSGPLDLDITPDGKYLYVLSSFIRTIQGYRIEQDGSLTHVASLPGFPFTMQGMIAR